MDTLVAVFLQPNNALLLAGVCSLLLLWRSMRARRAGSTGYGRRDVSPSDAQLQRIQQQERDSIARAADRRRDIVAGMHARQFRPIVRRDLRS